jgi:hypothetical protein
MVSCYEKKRVNMNENPLPLLATILSVTEPEIKEAIPKLYIAPFIFWI